MSYTVVGREVIVDLSSQSLPKDTPFVLACNVVWGTDDWDANDIFEYDPNSNLIASAQKYGPVNGGSLECFGTKIFNVEGAANRAKFRNQSSPFFTEPQTHS
jgi:hypothetical protein